MNFPSCPQCGHPEHVIKSGLNPTKSQRYRCQTCHHYFTLTRKPPGYDRALRHHALQLFLEGTSFRAIGRLLGVHHQTISNWITHAADALPARVSDASPAQTIELDELSTFVERKKTQSTSSWPSRAPQG